MNSNFGPWATSLDNGSQALCAFWKRRLRALPLAAGGTRRPTARALTLIGLVALVGAAAPLIELAPAAAPEATEESGSPNSPAAEPAQNPVEGLRVKLPEGLPQDSVVIGPARGGQPIRVNLPGGVAAEVVAVGHHPSQGKPWWGPDGQPTAAPYHDFASRVRPGDGFVVREIAIRWLAKPQGVTALYEIVGGGTSAADRPRDADGNYIDNLYTTARAFPTGAKTTDVRFTVADGGWENVVATDGRSDFAMGQGRYSFAFTQASMRTQGLTLSIAHNILDQDVRIIAIDLQGHEIAAPYGAHAGGAALRLTTGVFPELKIEDVQEFQVQTRPVHRVEVRNLSLVPDEVTEPEVVVVGEAPVN